MRYVTIIKNRGGIMVRVPNTRWVYFGPDRMAEAVAHRDKLCALLGLDIDAPKNRVVTECYANKATTDLPVGVCVRYYRKKLADGSLSITSAVQANAVVEGKSQTKAFSINKYGYDIAVGLAVEWRENKLEEQHQ